jgi:hypothetical protein
MRIVNLAMAVVAVAGLSFQIVSAQSARAPQTFKGHLVDVMCGTHHANEGAAYGEKHDKKCLLMEDCVKSGYALLTADNQVLKFDSKGSDLALALIKKTERDKDWRVTVTGTLSNGTIVVTGLSLE